MSLILKPLHHFYLCISGKVTGWVFFNLGGQHSLTFRLPPISGFWNPLRSCQQTQTAVQLKTVTLKRWERILRICYRTRKLVLSSLGKEKSRNGRNCKECSWEKTVAMTKTGAKRTEKTKRGCVSNCNQQNYAWEGMQDFVRLQSMLILPLRRVWIPYRENV